MRIGSEEVTLAELQAQIDLLPPMVRSRYRDSPNDRQELLTRMVDNEIFAHEAKRLGYEHDPEVARATKKAMAMKFLRDRLGDGPTPAELNDVTIGAYYEAHIERFAHPSEIRLTEIIVKSREKAVDVVREARRVAARARKSVRGDAQAAADEDARAFAALVQQYSEDADSRQRRGDLTLRDDQKDSRQKPLLDAALGLREVGDISEPIETTDGFHVVKLKQRVPAGRRPLAEVRPRIVRAIADEGRDRKVAELLERIRHDVKVDVSDPALERLRFEGPPATPPPLAGPAGMMSSAMP
jgi:parvulin-like peptidyl-prolyl isomerase